MSKPPLSFLILLTGALKRHEQNAIAYLLEENRILRAKLKKKRLRFSKSEKCCLALKVKALPFRMLQELASIVTPQALLSWHKEQIARKYTAKELTEIRKECEPYVTNAYR